MYAISLVKSAVMQQGFRSLTKAFAVPLGINICLFVCFSCYFLLLCFVWCRKLPDKLESTEETLFWVKADLKRTLLTIG